MRINGVVAYWVAAASMFVAVFPTAQALADEPAPAVASGAEAASTASSTQPSSQPAEETWPPGLLMKLLESEKVGVGKAMDDLGIRAWGFVETGFTGDLTNGQKTLFGRLYDARRANELRLNQFQLTVERPYDNTKDVDFGGRVDGVFGGDPMLTHAAGLLDHSGSGQGDDWTDVVQAYGQAWFKTGKDSGLELTFGKFLEIAGCESAEAVYNPLYSHSYIDAFAQPTTMTGVVAKYIFNSQASAYFGVVEGWDVFQDNNNAPSYIAGGTLSSAEQVGKNARDQLAFNIITGPEQTDNTSNFRNLVDATWTHWWTEKFSTALNGDFGTEKNVPGFGTSDWYGLAHYATYAFDDRVSATWRTEWFADDTGSRIGRAGNFCENTFGLNLTPWPRDGFLKNFSLRPELRWDHSDQPVFANEHDQMTLAIDLIFKF